MDKQLWKLDFDGGSNSDDDILSGLISDKSGVTAQKQQQNVVCIRFAYLHHRLHTIHGVLKHFMNNSMGMLWHVEIVSKKKLDLGSIGSFTWFHGYCTSVLISGVWWTWCILFTRSVNF